MGAFDSVATIVTDLGNATLNVISTLLTGDNAGVIISAVVVLAVVIILMRIPNKLGFGKLY
jgi:hypothetical protein